MTYCEGEEAVCQYLSQLVQSRCCPEAPQAGLGVLRHLLHTVCLHIIINTATPNRVQPDNKLCTCWSVHHTVATTPLSEAVVSIYHDAYINN